MGYKIAVATSDGLNVDLHFGSAHVFEIYTIDKLDFQKSESREIQNMTGQDQTTCRAEYDNVCESEDKTESSSGCSSGCGSRNHCENSERSESIEILSDCRCVVCKKIGRNMLKQFERKAISVFEIELPIKEALSKIVSYYYKLDERKLKYINQEE